MIISGKTQICGLIGDPVEHSVSAAMHNAAFEAMHLDYVYLPFKVSRDMLIAAINGMRALNIRGLNVTIPHKVAVIPFLDKLDSLSSKIGAVNTIVNDNGFLTGYNTDAEGFIRPLLEKDIETAGKHVLIVGAGGAARAVAFALMDKGAKLVLINRSTEKAKELANQLSNHFSGTVEAVALNIRNLEKAMQSTEIVVNTTSIGMGAGASETPVPSQFLRKGIILYDVVYNPMRTRLLREAESAGAVTIGGADMLAWQGALSFEKWTGKRAPIELMKQEVYHQLELHEN